MDFHVYFHDSNEVTRRLDAIAKQIAALETRIMAVLDDLEAKVTGMETVEASAIALLQGLKAALDAAIASGDMTRVKAVVDRIGTDTQTLADAVAANTPAAPPNP